MNEERANCRVKCFAEKNDHSTKVTKRQLTKVFFFLQKKSKDNNFQLKNVCCTFNFENGKWAQQSIKERFDEPGLTKVLVLLAHMQHQKK